ncbi:phosphoribosylglycinamide formyltransferase [Leptospira ognonensis]|uniref:Phosphoribosylglycinamide formyltransferase n=1 Tax=Leptospira ognonensis TaxID=2484945 RepID=A0A4V3JSB1_9LEPT|nr:phosphoribosylglycinamide formyltransferase [Leptospira ognonensis]TGL63920.1 phosphoribosylglycinamide formyltransferase [Leptospira ognonensis]
MRKLLAIGFKKKSKRILFLASGRGSNFEKAVETLRKKKLPMEILGLLTDNPKAKAIEIAKKLKIPIYLVSYADFTDKVGYHDAFLQKARELAPDLVVACGYMRILKPEFVKAFAFKILNIHPSLLPAFPGLDAQKQALEYGAKVTGCTVHFIEEGVDTGPVILQKSIEIKPEWGVIELSRAILAEEHKLLPTAIQLFCENKLKIKGRKVEILK